MRHTPYDAVVIGGGFFGCTLALRLKDYMDEIIILEKERDILQRASYANQARVHNGYHYPRSLLTAIRSRANFDRFIDEYRTCIDDNFSQYYAIGKTFSKITAAQFKSFCARIGAPLEPAPNEVRRLFNRDLVEDVFLTREHAFDAVKLKVHTMKALNASKITVECNSEVVRLSEAEHGLIRVCTRTASREDQIAARHVFACTYSQLNRLLTASDIRPIRLKHELAEVALIEVLPDLARLGITVMCGPFFSTMPFPPNGLHTLSHVRYTPHYSWQDAEGYHVDADECLRRYPKKSSYLRMIMDAQRYLPLLSESRYVGSIWEVKTVLPLSEVDDSRPILFKAHCGLRNLTCIMGGKIDNVYDMLDELDRLLAQRGRG